MKSNKHIKYLIKFPTNKEATPECLTPYARALVDSKSRIGKDSTTALKNELLSLCARVGGR